MSRVPAVRILVVGSGGIGGVLAARLLGAGHDVTVLTRNPSTFAALTAAGIALGGSAPRPVHAVLGEVPGGAVFDYALLTTQPPEVEDAAQQVAPFLGTEGRVVVFQNGLCEERVAQTLGSERVVGAVVAWGASTLRPGVYQQTAPGGFTLGTLPGTLRGEVDASVVRLGEVLQAVGPVVFTNNLTGVRWSKLAINCAISTLGTIGGQRLGALLRRALVRRLGLEILTEALQVARAEGVIVEPVAGTAELTRLALPTAPGPLELCARHAALLAVGLKYRNMRSSMLSAIERGRPPAVGFLNGEVTARGARHGVPTPVNQAALDAVWAIARGETRSSVQALEDLYRRTR